MLSFDYFVYALLTIFQWVSSLCTLLSVCLSLPAVCAHFHPFSLFPCCVYYICSHLLQNFLSFLSVCVCVCVSRFVWKRKKKEWNDLFTSGLIFSVHSLHRDLASMAVYRLSVCMCSYIFSLYSRVLLKDPSTLTAHWSFNTRWPPVPPQYNTHSRKHVKQCQICESGKLLIAARLPLSARLLWMESAQRQKTWDTRVWFLHPPSVFDYQKIQSCKKENTSSFTFTEHIKSYPYLILKCRKITASVEQHMTYCTLLLFNKQTNK